MRASGLPSESRRSAPGLAEYGVPEGLVRVDAPDGAGFDGAALTALRPPGQLPERIIRGATLPVEGAAAVPEASPSGALVLPNDAEYGPPAPDEGVDPSVAPAVDEEPTLDDLVGHDLLLPD